MTHPLHQLSGMNIHTSPLCVVQFRFPKSKKRRIRKKWASRPQNFRPDRKILIFDGKLICHPDLADELQKLISTK